MRILAGRAQLLGDQVCALPIAEYYRLLYPNAHIIWPVANKCKQGASLYENHPAINEIFVFDGKEGPESQRDSDLIKSCDIVVPCNPQHPFGEKWFNDRNIYEETWVMAGLPLEDYYKLPKEKQRPKLFFPLKGQKHQKILRSIGIWAQAGYATGDTSKRNPSREYWKTLVQRFIDEGNHVFQFGSEKDWFIHEDEAYKFTRLNSLAFDWQIIFSLLTNVVIATDSGSSLIIGAYEHPQVSLLRMYKEDGHYRNPLAFSTNNPNNTSLWSETNTHDDISQDLVLEKVYKKIKI